MSVNRILKKRRQQSTIETQKGQVSSLPSSSKLIQEYAQPSPYMPNPQQAQYQQKYSQFLKCLQNNPTSIEYSNQYVPYNATLQSQFRMPASIMLSPVLYQTEPNPRSIDKVAKCSSCRAYMTSYDKVGKKMYRCFVCGVQNVLQDGHHLVSNQNNVELLQTSYHMLGGENVYMTAPAQDAIIFMIDLNQSAAQTKMLYYFVAVVKQVLSRQQFNQTLIYFFTYDEVVHQYDFSGEQVRCTIIDPTIKNNPGKTQENFLINIRQKLFLLLDSLQQIAANNKKQGSNFWQIFSYVYESIKHTAGKIYICQSNQAISAQKFVADKKLQNSEPKRKSFLEPIINIFSDTYTHACKEQTLSCAFFVFQKNYKNLRVFGDFAKMTNSDLISYRKDSPQQLMKFYYELYYLLGATYYSDVKMELIITPGFYFSSVYGNVCRQKKQTISFKICHIQQSKKVLITFLTRENNSAPYCGIQIQTNYRFKKQHFICINTIVLPLTTCLQKLYNNQNWNYANIYLQKCFLSLLRMEEINQLRIKVLKQCAGIWRSANQFYKKKVPGEIYSLMASALAILKSPHFSLDSSNDTILMDKIIYERNILHGAGTIEMNNYFNPYLFNLSNMDQSICGDDQQNFIYPETSEVKFAAVKHGLFLLDNGLSLYLYIAKSCDQSLLKDLFGKQKILKTDLITQQSISTTSLIGQQITKLISVCRQQKRYGWIPLFIVRCGQSTLNQKQFYCNFYDQKYDQFKQYKMNLQQFIGLINQQY